MVYRRKQSLSFVRLMMVLSSLSPLFLLWAVRGMEPVPDRWLGLICVTLILVPNLVLILRVAIAYKRGDQRTIAVGRADDHRDHLLVYLFATLFPLVDANIGRTRDSVATITALFFVIFLFWHLNLHYINILFAVFGFRVFTLEAPGSAGLFVLLTKRTAIAPDTRVHAYRLSDSVFFEA